MQKMTSFLVRCGGRLVSGTVGWTGDRCEWVIGLDAGTMEICGKEIAFGTWVFGSVGIATTPIQFFEFAIQLFELARFLHTRFVKCVYLLYRV